MLHLRLNGLYRKTSQKKSFLRQIFLFIFICHLFLFGITFIVFSPVKKHDKYTISMHQSGATYVLMPLQKKVDQKAIEQNKKNSSSSKKSQVISYDNYLEHKKNNKTKNQGKLETKKIAVQKTIQNKKELEKSKKTEPKSTAILKDTPKIKQVLLPTPKKKNNIQAVQEKNSRSIQKTIPIEKKEKEITENIKQDNLEVVLEPKNVEVSDLKNATIPDTDNVIFVGYEQYDACVISSKIQQEIVQSWTPPTGLDPEISCEMKVVIAPNGTVDTIEIIKSSGVLVFDISARSALQQIEFPQQVHGKTIMIVLGN